MYVVVGIKQIEEIKQLCYCPGLVITVVIMFWNSRAKGQAGRDRAIDKEYRGNYPSRKTYFFTLLHKSILS